LGLFSEAIIGEGQLGKDYGIVIFFENLRREGSGMPETGELTRIESFGYDSGMMKKSLCIVATGIAFFATPSLRAEAREWTRATDGKKIQAEFAGMKDETTVKIKMTNGQVFEIPLSSLSAEDNAFVKKQNEPTGEPEKGAPKSGTKATVPEGEVTVTLSGVHLCCKDCEEAVVAAKDHDRVTVDPEVEITASRSDETVTIKAPSGKAAQAAVRAIMASGFYGKSDHDAIKIPDLKEDDFTTDTMAVRDVHICCRGCVRDFTKAVESVDGVEDFEAKVGSTRVTIKGEGFKTYEVMKALRDAGFGGGFQ
jgi:copper chaperone CopZ